MISLNSGGVQSGQCSKVFLGRGAENKLTEGERKNIPKGISNQRVCNCRKKRSVAFVLPRSSLGFPLGYIYTSKS